MIDFVVGMLALAPASSTRSFLEFGNSRLGIFATGSAKLLVESLGPTIFFQFGETCSLRQVGFLLLF